MNIDQLLVAAFGTYLLHSTLAIACAWLVTGPLRLLKEPRALRGTWKLAIFLPVLSSAFQLFAGYMPPAFYVIARTPIVAAAPIAHASVVESTSWATPTWTVVLSALWAFGAALGVWKLVKGELALRRMLSGREEVLEDAAVDGLISLRQAAAIERRIRLSSSQGLSTPIAVGRSEIVLSAHALEHLPAGQLRGVIAHELAHLEAHDPWWARTIAATEALFFFQPLNFWAKRRHRDAAELAADDWARALGVQGEDLARALAEIAAVSPRCRQPSWAQAARGGSLVRRVERLLAEPTASLAHLHAEDAARAQGMPRVAGGLGALAILALMAPRIGFASPDGECRKSPRGGQGASAFSTAASFRPDGHRVTAMAHTGPGSTVVMLSDEHEPIIVSDQAEWFALEVGDLQEGFRFEFSGDRAQEAHREAHREVQRAQRVAQRAQRAHRDAQRAAQRHAQAARSAAQRARAHAREAREQIEGGCPEARARQAARVEKRRAREATKQEAAKPSPREALGQPTRASRAVIAL